MNSKSNLIYALAAVTSLSLGLGIAFYRAASENHALDEDQPRDRDGAGGRAG